MVDSIEWLRVLISDHQSIEYLIIFLGVAFGGELVTFLLAFLAAQNFIAIPPFLILGFLGTFFSNTIWFLLGKTTVVDKITSHRYADKTVSIMAQAITKISKGNRALALTLIKFLVGTSVILIVYTSRTKLKWKEFILGESVAIFFSLLVVVLIGFIAGLGFTYLSNAFDGIYVAIGFILLIMVIIVMIQLWLKIIFTQKGEEIIKKEDNL